jgi:hypothetical protein
MVEKDSRQIDMYHLTEYVTNVGETPVAAMVVGRGGGKQADQE